MFKKLFNRDARIEGDKIKLGIGVGLEHAVVVGLGMGAITYTAVRCGVAGGIRASNNMWTKAVVEQSSKNSN